MIIPKWRIKKRSVRRLCKIAEIAARHGLGYCVEISGFKQLLSKKERKREHKRPPAEALAEKLRLFLEDLGPTFIKIGQLLSVRPDLVPPEIIFELEKLQDTCPPLDFSVVKREIEHSLNKKIEDVFSYIDPEPLASASLGQVHRAVLKENNNPVAVKIQRPGAKRIIDSDLDLLFTLARLLKKKLKLFFDPIFVVQQFADSLHQELDYRIEGRHADKFRFNFRSDPLIKVPLVYWKYSTGKILTMEYIEGTKLTDLATPEAAGIDTFFIAKHGAEAFMKQVLEDGFFHGDLHPANIMITKDGKIAYLDFGIVGEIEERDKEIITILVLMIIKQDMDEIVKQIQKLGVEISSEQVTSMRGDLKGILDRYYGRTLKELRIDIIGKEFLSVIYRHKIKIPENYALLVKALIILEGVGKQIYPEFNILEIAKPFAKELIKRRYPPGKIWEESYEILKEYSLYAAGYPKQIHEVLKKSSNGELEIRFRHIGLEETVKHFDRMVNRLIIGLIICSLIVSITALALVQTNIFLETIWFILAVILSLILFYLGFVKTRH
ncbi:MAG: AarF/ABC1/UbiB kinase family protein [Actinobacteria bacterium]|nr:AarF/ABC1/UbiB kinase family protein [Actinomycetota bacterium]